MHYQEGLRVSGQVTTALKQAVQEKGAVDTSQETPITWRWRQSRSRHRTQGNEWSGFRDGHIPGLSKSPVPLRADREGVILTLEVGLATENPNCLGSSGLSERA